MVSSKHYIVETKDDGMKNHEDYQISERPGMIRDYQSDNGLWNRGRKLTDYGLWTRERKVSDYGMETKDDGMKHHGMKSDGMEHYGKKNDGMKHYGMKATDYQQWSRGRIVGVRG